MMRSEGHKIEQKIKQNQTKSNKIIKVKNQIKQNNQKQKAKSKKEET